MKKELKNLMIIAMEARNYAYCPYSNYSVGAAILCKDGRIITGRPGRSWGSISRSVCLIPLSMWIRR